MTRMSNCNKLRTILAAIVATTLVGAAFAPAARAGNVINFDPTGGAVANSVLATNSFTWLPGNTDLVGGALTQANVGKDITVLYQAILGAIGTSGANSATLNSNSGDITTTLGGDTLRQIVITAQYTVKLTSLSGGVATFAPDLGVGTNAVRIYSQLANNANSANQNISSGVGFPTQPSPPGSTLILSGSVTTANFTSSFNEDTGSITSPVPLNQHGGGSGSYGGINQPPPAIQTVTGSGNTSLTVAVSSVNSSYFLGTTPVLTLNFNSITSGVPFRAVDPETVMFNGTVPGIATGQVNGSTSADFLYQSQANNDFTSVPEPTSISMGLTAIGVASVVAGLRRRKASKTA